MAMSRIAAGVDRASPPDPAAWRALSHPDGRAEGPASDSAEPVRLRPGENVDLDIGDAMGAQPGIAGKRLRRRHCKG